MQIFTCSVSTICGHLKAQSGFELLGGSGVMLPKKIYKIRPSMSGYIKIIL